MPFVFVSNENNQNSNASNGPWWKQGVALFSEISTWIVVPMILALVAGKALDKHFGTKPLWLLILAGAGFLITAYGMVKTIRQYAVKIKKEEEKK